MARADEAQAVVEAELNEIQAEFGRPQLVAGANAAVSVAINLLQQRGMSDDAAATLSRLFAILVE